MLLVFTVLLLATPAMANYRRIYPEEPEDMEFERTSNVRRPTLHLPCPHRAVCGVAYDFNRTTGGVARPERRIIHNCQCPGGRPCPMDPEHRLFESIRRREYVCRPVSNLRPCVNTDNWDRPAKEVVYGAEEYEFFPYNRVNCLCPRHNNPQIPTSRRQMELSTSIYRVRWDWGRHMTYHYRQCVIDPEDEN